MSLVHDHALIDIIIEDSTATTSASSSGASSLVNADTNGRTASYQHHSSHHHYQSHHSNASTRRRRDDPSSTSNFITAASSSYATPSYLSSPGSSNMPPLHSSRLRTAAAERRPRHSANYIESDQPSRTYGFPVSDKHGSLAVDVISPISPGVGSPASTSYTPSLLSRPRDPGRTPRERRFIVSPLNQLLGSISNEPTENQLQQQQQLRRARQSERGRMYEEKSYDIPNETKTDDFRPLGPNNTTIGTSSANGSELGSIDELASPSQQSQSSSPPIPRDYNLPLNPSDPVSVLFHERRARKQSVIKHLKPSVAFIPTEEHNKIPQSSMLALPSCCGGAVNMQIPSYITGPMSSVVLPSRLDVLGRRDFKALSVLDLHLVGNSVLGYAPIWTSISNLWNKGHHKVIKKQLFFLPAIFTRSTAYMVPFIKFVVFIIAVIGVLDFFSIQFNIGYYWLIGTAISLLVQYQLSRYKAHPDGVMSFCRSMGNPAIEEYMFSYCWKVQAENVRTLAKGLWNSGVGVWIDVVKLTPGDEIRPMLRTVVARVYRCVIFICPEYIASPNCCIELHEAVQHPHKLLFCILKEVPQELMTFMESLVPQGAQIVRGFPQLFKQLDAEIRDEHNMDYFQWWQTQDISGAGVPDEVVPTSEWPIPRFSLIGRWFLPEKTISCGPVFLAGDCSDAGLCVAIPWLLFGVLAACAICFWNIIEAIMMGKGDVVDVILLVCIFGINTCPIVLGGQDLIDTRRYIDATLRPLLASRAVGGGVLIEVVGDTDDFIVQILKKFLGIIGHLKPSEDDLHRSWVEELEREKVFDSQPTYSELPAKVLAREHDRRVKFHESHESLRTNQRVLKIIVMDTLESRLKYFSSDQEHNDSSAIYIWSGPGDPFTKDKVGERLMRFLVLVAAWERQNLSEAIFCAIGVRVVDLMHTSKINPQPPPSPHTLHITMNEQHNQVDHTT